MEPWVAIIPAAVVGIVIYQLINFVVKHRVKHCWGYWV